MEQTGFVAGPRKLRPAFTGRATVATAGLNGLVFINIETKNQQFVPTSSKRGVNVVASNPHGIYAFSYRENQRPKVFVCKGENNVLATLENGASLEYADLAVSRDSTRVVGVGAALKREMVVWDIASGEKLSSVNLGKHCSQVSFSPLNSSLVCVTGDDGVCFLEIREVATGVQLFELSEVNQSTLEAELWFQSDEPTEEKEQHGTKLEADLLEDVTKGQSSHVTPFGFSSHCWTKEGHVVAVTKDTSLVKIDPHTGKILRVLKGCGASSVQFIRDSLLVGETNGCLRWLKESSWSETGNVKLQDCSCPVIFLTLSTDYETCLAMTDDGRQYLLRTNSPTEEPSLLSEAHTGCVVGLTPLYGFENNPLIGSISTDGTFKVWDSRQGFNFSKPVHSQTFRLVEENSTSPLDYPSAICSSPRNQFTLIGTKTGHVKPMIVYKDQLLSKDRALAVCVSVGPTLRAHDGPIRFLKFDPSGNLVASIGGNGNEHIICVLRAPTAEKPTLSLVGIIEIEDQIPLGISWQRFGGATWLIITTTSANSGTENAQSSAAHVYRAQVDQLDLSETTRVNAESIGSLDWLANRDIGNTIVLESGKLVAPLSQGVAQSLDVFEVPKVSRVGNISCVSHQGSMWTVSNVPGCSWFAAGSLDGTISVWDDSDHIDQIESSAKTWSGLSSCISALCFSSDAMLLVAGCVDGSISLLSLKNLSQPSLKPDGQSFAAPEGKAIGRLMKTLGNDSNRAMTIESALNEPTEYFKWKKRAQDILDEDFERKKNQRRGKVDKLKQRLLQLLENNETVPELEKLERHEFVIDTVGKDTICAENERHAENLRAVIERGIKERELVFERIKKECWDSIEIQSREIHGLGKRVIVRNFPIPKQSDKEKQQVQRIKQLRSVELKEMEIARQNSPEYDPAKNSRLLKMIPEDVDWIVNAGVLQPAISLESMENTTKSKKGDEKPAKAKDSTSAAKEPSVNNGEDDDEGHSGASSSGGEGGEGGENKEGGANNQVGRTTDSTEESTSLTYELIDLLYHPASIRTTFQKRSQLVLLKQVQREMMISFNQKFHAAIEHKEDAVERITSKYERINEIQNELRSNLDPLPKFWDPSEKPESIFDTSSLEIGVEKYLSKSERARLAKEEEERRRREEEAAKDNMGERALDDMMNGTLEAAKELSLAEKDLERPEWMSTIEYADMSEEQRREFDEFEVKYQKFMEEKEKYTKGLEQELKKLHSEVQDAMRVFDEYLEDLTRLKVSVLEGMTIQGLYSARITLSLLRQEDFHFQERRVEGKIAELRSKLGEISSSVNGFTAKFEKSKAELAEKHEADKSLEKSFKTQVQEYAVNNGSQDGVDIELLRVLQQLFKQRSGRKRNLLDEASHNRGTIARSLGRHSSDQNMEAGPLGSSRSSLAPSETGSPRKTPIDAESSDIVPLNPFTALSPEEIAAEKELERTQALAPLNRERDLPEGIFLDNGLWDLLQKLRHKKILSELDVKTKMEKVAKLQSQYDELESDRRDCEKQLNSQIEALRSLTEARRLDAQNIELIVRVKQGQDEVKAGAVTTDYSKSLLLDRSVVEKVNKEIMTLGDGKVGIMNKMKEFRKSINFMQWEHRFMLQQEYDLEEHYTDLHMLRVTRGLQEMIKGGEVTDRQEQTQQAEAKLVKLNKVHKVKLQKNDVSLKKLHDKKTELENENNQLEERIKDLRTSVEMRDAVYHARCGQSLLSPTKKSTTIPDSSNNTNGPGPAGSGATAAKARMKAVVTRRKLVDLARAQSTEIEFLKQELEQLRESNFPRFANPSAAFAEKRFRKNPDQK